MNSPLIRFCLAASATVLCAASANAQSSGTSGLTGSTSGLSGLSSGSSGSSTGSSSLSSGSSSSSAMSGTSGAANPALTTNANPGFVGGNATQTFVGGARTTTGQQGANRQFQAFQNSQVNSTSQSQSTGTPRSVRTSLRVGFRFPTASSSQLSGRLAIQNAPALTRYTASHPELSGIDVSLNSEGVAVLTGSSSDVEASRLAANLIRLQPGVRKVENRIAVLR